LYIGTKFKKISTVDLKNRVIRKIESLNEDYVLEEVLALIEFETNPNPLELSPEQISAIDKARIQIKNGEIFTNEEVDKEIDQWLNK